MNTPVFLTTLGQRPEAITMALDILYPRYHYAEIGILHTDPSNPTLQMPIPYSMHKELAELPGKSVKTVENQLGSIYSKLLSPFDLEIEDNHKRQVLLDVLFRRVRTKWLRFLSAINAKVLKLLSLL